MILNFTAKIQLLFMFSVIPLALLVQPYFRADVPRYIPYATMGSIFAHEILHAFDSRGIDYDANGQMVSSWSPEARIKFETKLDCIKKQLSSVLWRKVQLLDTDFDVQVQNRFPKFLCNIKSLIP